jgi:hypothetical protein
VEFEKGAGRAGQMTDPFVLFFLMGIALDASTGGDGLDLILAPGESIKQAFASTACRRSH